MKWAKWGLVLVLVVAAIVVFSTNVFQKKYTYYYYPEWNAYYDVGHKNYIYSVDGGKTWDTTNNTSNTIVNTLGQKVVLHSNDVEIWMHNGEHRNQYGGTLNDLVGSFLETGEDKRVVRKKNTLNDSSQYQIKTDSLAKDNMEEIDNWAKETIIQEHGIKEHNEEKEDAIPANNESDLVTDTIPSQSN